MEFDTIRTAIEQAVCLSVQHIQLPGIVDARMRSVAVTSPHLQQVATQLACLGQGEIRLAAEIEFFLRVSNTDLLRSIQRVPFRVEIRSDDHGAQAVSVNEESWAVAWEKGMDPIKQAALRYMKEDVWKIDPTLEEDSSVFQTAMILLASELVGPWSDRIATFLGYPRAMVQAVAARLYEARIWKNDEVRSEKWFDPETGGVTFLADLMVAEGLLIRRWSEEKQQFAYRATDMPTNSHFAIQ